MDGVSVVSLAALWDETGYTIVAKMKGGRSVEKLWTCVRIET